MLDDDINIKWEPVPDELSNIPFVVDIDPVTIKFWNNVLTYDAVKAYDAVVACKAYDAVVAWDAYDAEVACKAYDAVVALLAHDAVPNTLPSKLPVIPLVTINDPVITAPLLTVRPFLTKNISADDAVAAYDALVANAEYDALVATAEYDADVATNEYDAVVALKAYEALKAYDAEVTLFTVNVDKILPSLANRRTWLFADDVKLAPNVVE